MVLEADLSLMQCPGCGGDLVAQPQSLACKACEARFPIEDGIPILFWPNEWEGDARDVTDQVKAFYEETPFPNYDDFDSVDSLARKAREGIFARLLDEQVPPGARSEPRLPLPCTAAPSALRRRRRRAAGCAC